MFGHSFVSVLRLYVLIHILLNTIGLTRSPVRRKSHDPVTSGDVPSLRHVIFRYYIVSHQSVSSLESAPVHTRALGTSSRALYKGLRALNAKFSLVVVDVCYGFAGVGKICVGDDIFGTVDCTCDARLVAKLSVPLTRMLGLVLGVFS